MLLGQGISQCPLREQSRANCYAHRGERNPGVLVLAFIFGAIANRLRMPPLVGYLIAGVLSGPHTPGFVADQGLAPELAEIGVLRNRPAVQPPSIAPASIARRSKLLATKLLDIPCASSASTSV